ncbi:Endochitinase 2 [Escovopsis weberi]|uniref:chitinase n=1 Tax=Escovopsis weberi TaxID=150374 RepID=A0A0M8N0P6_ESCWE|nr:Endochitinase 2 [Escovopsis weberi]
MALAAAGGGSGGVLNGFFGQFSSDRLRDHCDSGIDTITLSFVTSSPENEPSGLPGTNFAGHCWSGTYTNDDGVESDLQSNCYWMKQDIPYCKARGVKILLSIGGESSLTGYSYDVGSDKNGESFADFLYGAFGPYNSHWKGPRPFDIDDTHHTSVDGFDFDIENAYDNHPYIAMIDRFRSVDPSLMITGSPQCPLLKPYAYMSEMIQAAAFDRLNIQFYNNPGCNAAPDSALLPVDDETDITNSLGLSNKFNYDDWEKVLANSDASQGAKIFIGLPASPDAAQNGYLTPEQMKYLICKYQNRPHFGGLSLWDISYGSSNVIDGKTYQDHALEGLQYGCSAVTTPTSKTSARKTKTKSKSKSKSKATTTSAMRTTLATTSAVPTTTSAHFGQDVYIQQHDRALSHCCIQRLHQEDYFSIRHGSVCLAYNLRFVMGNLTPQLRDLSQADFDLSFCYRKDFETWK